jgi:hypothetical protein
LKNGGAPPLRTSPPKAVRPLETPFKEAGHEVSEISASLLSEFPDFNPALRRVSVMSKLPPESYKEFFNYIREFDCGYDFLRFSFLAIRNEVTNEFVIIKARLFLSSGIPVFESKKLKTTNVFAGSFVVERGEARHIKLDELDLVKQVLSGVVRTPQGTVSFYGRNITFNPHFIDGQESFAILSISSDEFKQADQFRLIDWELRAATEPYDGLQDLALDLGLGSVQNPGESSVEIIASNVMVLHLDSTVQGDIAHMRVKLAAKLNPALVSVGFKEFKDRRLIKRSHIPGNSFDWREESGFLIGSKSFNVSGAAALQCFCTYAGKFQHLFWFADPSIAQNTKRVAYEIIDPKLSDLRQYIKKDDFTGKDARNVEAYVSWLLWMLGFSAAHFGKINRSQDAVDIVATTPFGHFVLVECTTGLLKPDNKIPKLLQRAQLLRAKLEDSANGHLKVLAAMVTTKGRDEIAAELEQVERHGILVLTRENLEKACDDTLSLQDADQLFKRAIAAVEAQQRKFFPEKQLPPPYN